MKKWIVWGLTTLCSLSSFAGNQIPDIDRLSSKNNPATMAYYVDHYNSPESNEYRDLILGVRVAADAINFQTMRLDERNQRIDYCLPMRDLANRENLSQWKVKDLMILINNRINNDPMLKKYGKAGIGGSIGRYLTLALNEQYPCNAQKQRSLENVN